MELARVSLDAPDLPNRLRAVAAGDTEILTDGGSELAVVLPLGRYNELMDAERYREVRALADKVELHRAEGREVPGTTIVDGPEEMAAFLADPSGFTAARS